MNARVFCIPIVLSLLAALPARAQDRPGLSLLLATTTSVRDSGLLDTLLPAFTESSGISVRVVAVGTGAALRMGAEGNADVLLTHAKGGENELVASGAAVSRRPFMQNFFVIAGPPSDPAGVGDAMSPEDAMRRIAERPSPYVSRGDDSGTHRRERALLLGAELDPSGGWEGYTSTGSGMGLTLQVAGERRAYTLSDLGTFLAFEKRVGLAALSNPGPSLRNVYSVLRVSPERFPGRVQGEHAERFEAFLLTEDAQRRIGEFGRAKYGRALFEPLLFGQAP